MRTMTRARAEQRQLTQAGAEATGQSRAWRRRNGRVAWRRGMERSRGGVGWTPTEDDVERDVEVVPISFVQLPLSRERIDLLLDDVDEEITQDHSSNKHCGIETSWNVVGGTTITIDEGFVSHRVQQGMGKD